MNDIYDQAQDDIIKRGPRPRPPILRLMARVSVVPSMTTITPHWLTDYTPNEFGYVVVRVGTKLQRGHRLTYEHFVGPIPDGLVLDHLCRTPGCVNPLHVEPVSQPENVARGDSPGARARRSNQCKWGHSLDDAYVRTSGHRYCRTCSHDYNAQYVRKRTR